MIQTLVGEQAGLEHVVKMWTGEGRGVSKQVDPSFSDVFFTFFEAK